MNPDFMESLEACRQRVDNKLRSLTIQATGPATDALDARERLATACEYVVGSGGKRIRPALVYLAARAVDGPAADDALDFAACAVELIHTYSLVHDDLPAMDDDDLRRGRPSLHRAYDEATAILVGDGLQARAFELLANAPALDDRQRVEMIAALAHAAGVAGMVGGQFIDIQAVESTMSLADLQAMHSLKTGALICASLALGGIAARAEERQMASLRSFGAHIGLAFQIVDDVLDVIGDTATLGKTRGKDGAANKPTYVTLMGLEGARSEVHRILELALACLECFGPQADPLRELARFVVQRDC